MAARQMEEHKAERVEKLQRVKALGLHLNHNKRFAETEHKCCTCDRPLNPATELQPFLSKQVPHKTILDQLMSLSWVQKLIAIVLLFCIPALQTPHPPLGTPPFSPFPSLSSLPWPARFTKLHDVPHTAHSTNRQQTLMHCMHQIQTYCTCACARLVYVTAIEAESVTIHTTIPTHSSNVLP